MDDRNLEPRDDTTSMLLTLLTALGFLWPHHHGVDATTTTTTTTWNREISNELHIRTCFLMPKTRIHPFRRHPDGTTNIFTGMKMHDALFNTDVSDNPATNHGDTNEASITLSTTRCSSRDAASIIQNCSATDGLLVITCDASGRGVRSNIIP